MWLANGFFRDLPNVRQLLDYDVRTDGQPVYLGHAQMDKEQTDESWVIFKFTYNASGFVEEIESVGEKRWDLRAAYFT